VSCKDANNPSSLKLEGDHFMKRLGVAFLALAFTFSAYAAKNSTTVNLTGPVQVGSATLPAGPVKVTWTGTGSDAQLTLAPYGKTPVTVPAQVVAVKNGTAAVQTIEVKGVQYLQEIELDNLTLVVRNAPGPAVSSGN
jgi:hypothetical protein